MFESLILNVTLQNNDERTPQTVCMGLVDAWNARMFSASLLKGKVIYNILIYIYIIFRFI